jgi:hypothetical protein
MAAKNSLAYMPLAVGVVGRYASISLNAGFYS